MRAALARHDEIVRAAIEAYDGHVFSTAGDSFVVAFSTTAQATEAAIGIQRGLALEEVHGEGLRVRAAIHVGTAQERGGDYFGPAVNRTARLMASAHGGQIVVSNVAHALLKGYAFVDLGEPHLKDLSEPERVWGLMFDNGEIFPALRTAASYLDEVLLDARPLPRDRTPVDGHDESVCWFERPAAW